MECTTTIEIALFIFMCRLVNARTDMIAMLLGSIARSTPDTI
jgi:hypothetical protein